MSLVAVFGNTPTLKVLDFLRVHSFWDYSIKDMSRETDLSYRTVQKLIPNLQKTGLLKYTRTEGKAKLYKIDKENKMFKQLQTIAVLEDVNAVCVIDDKTHEVHNDRSCERSEERRV